MTSSDLSPIYLDHNATTPVAPEVVRAMAPYWTDHFFNPSAAYPEAEPARMAVADARAALAALLDAAPETIFWTSGGTESNNWVIRGAWKYWRKKRRRIVVSAIEHPAVMQTVNSLDGVEVVRLPVDGDGVVRLDVLDDLVDERTALVSVMLANNEVGTMQPIAEVAGRAHAVGAWMHTDAAQAVGKISVNISRLGVDFLTVAGHKFYAPKGIGALYIRPGLPFPPLLTGGGQERGMRSGTEPVALIAGLGTAARMARRWLASEGPIEQARLRDSLQTQLMDGIPRARVFARDVARLPNTLAFAVPGIPGGHLLSACPHVRAGTGSACHHPDDVGSPTLAAMGVASDLARGLVRLSLGRETTQADIAAAAQALIRAARTLEA